MHTLIYTLPIKIAIFEKKNSITPFFFISIIINILIFSRSLLIFPKMKTTKINELKWTVTLIQLISTLFIAVLIMRNDKSTVCIFFSPLLVYFFRCNFYMCRNQQQWCGGKNNIKLCFGLMRFNFTFNRTCGGRNVYFTIFVYTIYVLYLDDRRTHNEITCSNCEDKKNITNSNPKQSMLKIPTCFAKSTNARER